MSEKVIVPIDLSQEAGWRLALPKALERVYQVQGTLHFITVVPYLPVHGWAFIEAEDPMPRIIAEAEKQLQALVREHVPGDIETEVVVRVGSPHREINRFAGEIGADLIVMASHDPDERALWVGSNAAKVVSGAPCSVWVVRKKRE
jgi:nucleotide-binding universal stress UspA family protein